MVIWVVKEIVVLARGLGSFLFGDEVEFLSDEEIRCKGAGGAF